MKVVNVRKTLRSIASLVSVDTNTEITSNPHFSSIDNLKLEVPCLSSSGNSSDCSNDNSNSANAVLKKLLQTGNPFPPKRRKAKGKKKLQKRRRSSKILALDLYLSKIKRLADKDEEVQNFMSEPLTFNHFASSVPGTSTSSTGTSSTANEKNSEDEKSLQESDICNAPNALNQHIKDTVQEIITNRVTMFLSQLIYKDMKRNSGELSYEAAKVLSGSSNSIKPNFNTEENDTKAALISVECDDNPNECATSSNSTVSPKAKGHSHINGNGMSNHSESGAAVIAIKVEDQEHSPVSTEVVDQNSNQKDNQDVKENGQAERNSNISSTASLSEEDQDQQKESNDDNETTATTTATTTANDTSNNNGKAITNETYNVDHVAKIKSIHERSPSLRVMLGLEKPQNNELNDKDVDHVAKIKSIHEKSPSLKALSGLHTSHIKENDNDDEEHQPMVNDQVDHVARIKSIHENSPSLKSTIFGDEDCNSVENTNCSKRRQLDLIIKNCSTSFTILDDDNNDEKDAPGLEATSLSVPIQFQAVIDLVIMTHKMTLRFGSSGSISVNLDYKEGSTDVCECHAKIALDIGALHDSIVDQTKHAIKEVILSNRAHATYPNRRINISYRPNLVTSSSSKDDKQHHDVGVVSNRNTPSPPPSQPQAQSQLQLQLQSQLSSQLSSSQPIPSQPAKDVRNSKKRAINGTQEMNHNKVSPKRPKLDEHIEASVSTKNPVRRKVEPRRSIGKLNGKSKTTPVSTSVSKSHIPSTDNNMRIEMNNVLGQGYNSMANQSNPLSVDVMKLSEIETALNTLRQREHSELEVLRKAEESRLFGSNNPFGRNTAAASLSSSNQQSGSTSSADFLRLVEMYRNSSTSANMAAAAEQVRQMEMENATNQNNSMNANSSSSDAAQKTDFESAWDSLRKSNTGSSMSAASEIGRVADQANDDSFFASLRRSSGYGIDNSMIENVLNALRRRSSAGNSMTAAAEAVRMAEMDATMNSFRRSSAGNSMAAAAEAVRLAEMNNLRRSSAGNSMAAAAEAVRLTEMNNFRRSSAGNSMAAAAEAVRLAEMNNIRRSSGGNSMAAAAEAVRLAEMNNLRRSSAGNSMAAAAEAVRLAEMDAARNNLRHSSAGNSMAAAAEAVRMFERNSLRLNSAGNSMATAEAVRLAEIDAAMNNFRRNSGNSMAAAAEAVRLAEMNNFRRSSAGNSMGAAAEAVRLSEAQNINFPHAFSQWRSTNNFNMPNSTEMKDDEFLNLLGSRLSGNYNLVSNPSSDTTRYGDLESSLQQLGQYNIPHNLQRALQDQMNENNPRGGQSRRRVSFSLDDTFRGLTGFNNGFQP